MTKLLEEWTPSRREWFRDESQLQTVREVLHARFADTRSQEECRYLMRLWWHLDMGYQEVSYDELCQFVSPSKLARLNKLFDLMAERNYDAIDAWSIAAQREMEKTHNR